MPALVRAVPVLFLLLALPRPEARAADCGGPVACRCGDTLVTSTTLTADLAGCTRTGLRVAAGVTLDCTGHGLLGRSSSDGFVLEDAAGAQVRNCRIEGFRTGIRVSGGADQLLSGNQLVGNRRGITVDDGARATRIEGNVVQESREIGILLQAGTSDVALVRNTVHGSRKENVRITSSHGVSVEVNVLGGSPRVALQMTHTREGRIRGNEIQGSDVEVRGDCTGNLFLDNDLLDGGFDVKTQEAGEVVYAPTHNTFQGGSIPNARLCFRLAGASHNLIRDVRIGECRGRPVELRTSDGIAPVGNVIDLPTTGGGGGDEEDGVCGGAQECACGDRVTSSTRLESDLTDCGKTGLVVAGGVTLDCAGFGVFGNSSSDGIRVEGEGARVRNCRVQGFNAGVRIKDGTGHLVSANTLSGNRRGIVVDGAASDATLDDNLIEGSRDIGIELRAGTAGIAVTRNTVLDSDKENVEIDSAQGPVVDGNVLGGKTDVGLRLTDTTGARIRGNTVETAGVVIRGGSTDNEILDNDLEDLGYELSGIEERSGPWRFPQRNRIRGGDVLNARRCFRFLGASFNTVEGVGVRECAGREVESKSVDGHVPTGNVVDVVVR